MGALIALFSTIGSGTPVWQILLQGFLFGFTLSMQYTSTNTLVYADIAALDASMASTISSTMHQLSMSFGVCVGFAGGGSVPARPVSQQRGVLSH
jgi:hypothetical protein